MFGTDDLCRGSTARDALFQGQTYWRNEHNDIPCPSVLKGRRVGAYRMDNLWKSGPGRLQRSTQLIEIRSSAVLLDSSPV